MGVLMPLILAIGGPLALVGAALAFNRLLDIPYRRNRRTTRVPQTAASVRVIYAEHPAVGGFSFEVAEQEGLWRR